MKAFTPTNDVRNSVVLGEVSEPEPQPDDVVIEVNAFSVNRGETFQLEHPAVGWRPGKDVAGTVIQSAADGSGPDVGTRVVAHPPSAGWAERVCVQSSRLAVLPADFDLQIAAALPLAGLTALRLLRTVGSLVGRRILMTGASGGVGHYFTELAAAAGAEMTVITATPERGARLAALGATRVVHDVSDAVGPFDVVLESVGSSSLQQALCKLKPRGTLIWFGQASRVPPVVDFFRFWEGPVSGTIRHFDYTDSDIPDGRDLATLVKCVTDGRLHPEIGLIADWRATPEVLDMLRMRDIRGNAVLVPHRL